MTTLCQIVEISDERDFLEDLKLHGRPTHFGIRREIFYSHVPAIHTTIEIYDGNILRIFRVLYHHLSLRQESLMPRGSLIVEGYYVFVVRVD